MVTIKSVSIAARVVLEMHALNNEGNESNRLMTRQVGIVTPVYNPTQPDVLEGYEKAVVNAISGDMNKHMFADAFRHIALELGLPLCDACQALDPARMMGNPDFREFIAKKPPVNEVIDRLLTCAVDDVCGIMVTGESTSVKRKSAIEFGWTVGLPGANEVQEFIHARHAITRLTRTKATRESDQDVKDQAQSEKQQNIGQMIFNRPASSGVYAFVAHLDACAIGFNDASQTYPIEAAQRLGRLKAALLALGQVLLQPKGALTSTQLPHVVDVQGFVSLSQSAAAAPLVSPLMDNFVERGQNVGAMLRQLHGEKTVFVLPFQGPEELLGRVGDTLESAAPGLYREF
jgi:CRISPR-associated protein Cst2